MNTHPPLACLALALLALPASAADDPAGAIPFSEIGARAGADYKGDAIGIRPVPDGARLNCGFQRLEGHATPEGLWLTSTEDGSRLRLLATEVGRSGNSSEQSLSLAPSGQIHVAEKIVSFVRPGLTEQYSISVDGLRQDFIVAERPPGEGELRVGLGLTGARTKAVPHGAILALDGSGRELAYSRLRVLDAHGKELTARIEAVSDHRLAILVQDAGAAYPVRIDPTFSDADWSSLGTTTTTSGANGMITAVAVVGSDVYVGGSFSFIGNTPARNVARWNGSSWSRLGSATQNGAASTVRAIAAPATNAVYVGGDFTTVADASAASIFANRIALWNGSSWSRLGSASQNGAGATVYAMAATATNAVYVGGSFTSVADASSASIAANRIALWNGSSWSRLGSATQNGAGSDVRAIAALASNAAYIGGLFTNVADASSSFTLANRVALWNGSTWSPLGSASQNGAASSVTSIAAPSTNAVYVGGSFTSVADASSASIAANRIALWNGSSWSPLGTPSQNGANGVINALSAPSTNAVYVGGSITSVADASAASIAVSRVALWNGSSWSRLGTPSQNGAGNDVLAIAALSTNAIYVGGFFTTVADATNASLGASRIARWNATPRTWSPMPAADGGANGTINALAMVDGDLYVGGSFTRIGSTNANRVARWDGSQWSPLGSATQNGAGSTINAIAAHATNVVYVAGSFTNVADASSASISANRVALWNGSSWSRLGTPSQNGAGNEVRSIAALSSNAVYVGGVFTSVADASASFIVANRIAHWNGSSWSRLGSATQNGAGSSINAIAALSSNAVYVGGSFTNVADGSSSFTLANRVALWNGSTWSPLGSATQNGAGSSVNAIAAFSTNAVYVCGDFTTVADASTNSVSANRIALWNGSSWSRLGSATQNGAASTVSAIAAFSSNEIYIGGFFTTVADASSSSIPANNIARWNATTARWTALGGGVDSFVNALVTDGSSQLFLGGSFLTAGTNPFTISPYVVQSNVRIPEIAIEQPAGIGIADGGTGTFGNVTIGTNASLTFIIRNMGDLNLFDPSNPTNIVITVDGAHASDFSVLAHPEAPLPPGGSNTFTVLFYPIAAGSKTAAVHIASNDTDENPYDITLTGAAFAFTSDTDGDGLNDASEIQLASLGFDPATNQASLVHTLLNNLDGALPNLNAEGFFSGQQIRDSFAPYPLIQRNETNRIFTLTIGVEKSSNLVQYAPFPMSAPQITNTPSGEVEFQFTLPDNRAFFRLRPE